LSYLKHHTTQALSISARLNKTSTLKTSW